MTRKLLLACVLGFTAARSTAVRADTADDILEQQARQHLTTLGQAVGNYALHNNGSFPKKVSDLYKGGFVTDLEIFLCPGSDSRIDNPAQIDAAADYAIASRLTRERPMLLVREKQRFHGEAALGFFSNQTIRAVTANEQPPPTAAAAPPPPSAQASLPPPPPGPEGSVNAPPAFNLPPPPDAAPASANTPPPRAAPPPGPPAAPPSSDGVFGTSAVAAARRAQAAQALGNFGKYLQGNTVPWAAKLGGALAQLNGAPATPQGAPAPGMPPSTPPPPDPNAGASGVPPPPPPPEPPPMTPAAAYGAPAPMPTPAPAPPPFATAPIAPPTTPSPAPTDANATNNRRAQFAAARTAAAASIPQLLSQAANYYNSHQLANALMTYGHVLRIQPNNPDSLAGAAMCYLSNNQPASALPFMQRYLQVAPTGPFAAYFSQRLGVQH